MSLRIATSLCIVLVVLWPLSTFAKRFDVEIQNGCGNEQVEIGVAQIHSENFDSTPPKVYSEALVVQTFRVVLAPQEKRSLVFDDKSKGYWLTWRLINPLPEPSILHTVSLLKGERVINVCFGSLAGEKPNAGH